VHRHRAPHPVSMTTWAHGVRRRVWRHTSRSHTRWYHGHVGHAWSHLAHVRPRAITGWCGHHHGTTHAR